MAPVPCDLGGSSHRFPSCTAGITGGSHRARRLSLSFPESSCFSLVRAAAEVGGSGQVDKKSEAEGGAQS
jgi:hypothetical protein